VSAMNADSGEASRDLRALCSDLQTQVAHSLVVEQELIYARDRLDRDVARFAAIGAYSRRAIRAESLRQLALTTAEAIIEAFDLECSAVLLRAGRGLDGSGEAPPGKGAEAPAGATSDTLVVEASFGLDEQHVRHCTLDMGWVASRGLLRPGAVLIEKVEPGVEPWRSAGLADVIVCSLADEEGAFEGLLLGGVSEQKRQFYGGISQEIAPSFVVFSEQMQSLLRNLRSRGVIRGHVAALGRTNAELRDKTSGLERATQQLAKANRDLERRLTELSTLHSLATVTASILDIDQLLDRVLQSAVRDLGYDRAMIMLVDEERGVLGGGRVAGVPEEMARYVERLERPLREGEGVLVRVALTGEPVLVEGAERPGSGLDLEIADTLKAGWSLIAVPLKTKEKVIGVLGVDNFRLGARLTREDQSLLATLAGQVAIAVENARLMRRLAMSERLSAIGEMAAGIAHEIRNPLTSINTLVDIMESQARGVDPVVFRGVREESRRLQDLTTRFLSYARPYAPVRSPADINLILEEVTSLLALDERFRGIRIERTYDRSIGDLSIDGDAIKQVCWNLILNGLEVAPPGGRLAVRSEGHPEFAEIAIADNGPGIGKEALRRVFEPFYTTKDKGTGLGLPIADKIVRAHGGTIDIRSEPGAGTTVRVLLPRATRGPAERELL
jgi:signal transduction histidine kinase